MINIQLVEINPYNHPQNAHFITNPKLVTVVDLRGFGRKLLTSRVITIKKINTKLFFLLHIKKKTFVPVNSSAITPPPEKELKRIN